jgi:hypothetical protein
MKLISFITIITNIFLCTSHSFMNYPVCRRSKYSSYYVNKNLVDYNIMAPLNTYGYTFPCKGFPEGPAVSTITTDDIEIIIDPSPPIHGGGHCQFGITYDDKIFIVLRQVISTCLLDDYKYKIKLPQIPNGKVTIFWTSINAIGNREYYMDCADVIIDIPNNNIEDVTITGKELIIVNLPGYETIPEFPDKGMYDGRELLENANNISIKLKNTITTPTLSTTETINTKTTYTTSTTEIMNTEIKSAKTTPTLSTMEIVNTEIKPTKTIDTTSTLSESVNTKTKPTKTTDITIKTFISTTNSSETTMSFPNTTPYIEYNNSSRNNFYIYYFLILNFIIIFIQFINNF